jgi:3-oxoacyl-[acyl-carrier-protein] synthase II
METLRAGRPCVDDIRNLRTEGYVVKAAGEIRHAGEVVRTDGCVDRKVHFFELALRELAAQTRFDSRYAPEELMLNVGGGVDYFDMEGFFASHPDLVANVTDGPFYHQMAAEMRELAARWHIGAGCHLFASACTASAQALGLSWRLFRKGLAQAVVSGGADSMISHPTYLGFYVLGTLAAGPGPSATLCKPCDRFSAGTVLGEASVAVMLEDSARLAPDTPVLAELCGYGCSMDAYSVTDPDPSGAQAAEAIREALDTAGITPDQVDCIHLHGTGTVKCGPAEYNSVERVFGRRAAEIPVYSMKGQMGHMIGSCTAVELLGVVYSLQHQAVLPTVNYSTPHPQAPFHVVTGAPLRMPVRYILKLNSAFGGHNTALVFKRWER